ncbi:helix-turn-helix domain-containing protein [Cupriavidus plantarum]|uniref:helix-turn-helix domain-containing protein n=1 Tax=Cupriavidus plantarum TaxID=942865 RepID=UPI000E3933A9|nr:AraC family transcriptional regulator [Cupriavidus plantarum]REE90698.1 AraC-like DNA-binding protein [Cupriavidus plantarum]CAG2151810.1 HTH-type transcriptional activator RhaS [Cupriavidus plantarum]SMR85085.1 AraC-type DNA-binding protein [Cupriavidus plantarum]
MTAFNIDAPREGAVFRAGEWRDVRGATGGLSRVLVARWTDAAVTEAVDVSHAGHDGLHCVALTLRGASVRFVSNGQVVCDGRVPAGMIQITAPGTPVSATFHTAYDVLHLFVPQGVLAKCYEARFGQPHDGPIVLDDPRAFADPTVERLAQALALAHANDATVSHMFCESVTTAIVARLVAQHFSQSIMARIMSGKSPSPSPSSSPSRQLSPLPQWRLRRAIEFIDAHLSRPLTLEEIARSVGLTRMYFAAQFRRATGVRPQEFVQRRRVELAQEILRREQCSVLDVAMHCGFRSQAHFTTVFKRFVGRPPLVWRNSAVTAS